MLLGVNPLKPLTIVTQAHVTEDLTNLTAIQGDDLEDHLETLSKTGLMTFISGLSNIVGSVLPQAKQYSDYISSKSEQIAETIGNITPLILAKNTYNVNELLQEASKAQVTSLFKQRLSTLKEESATPTEAQKNDHDSGLTI